MTLACWYQTTISCQYQTTAALNYPHSRNSKRSLGKLCWLITYLLSCWGLGHVSWLFKMLSKSMTTLKQPFKQLVQTIFKRQSPKIMNTVTNITRDIDHIFGLSYLFPGCLRRLVQTKMCSNSFSNNHCKCSWW